MTNYVVIAHKPESYDYCKGCLRESWAGDFDRLYTTDLDKVINNIMFYYKFNDVNRNTYEAYYSLYIYINGVPCETIENIDRYLEGEEGIEEESKIYYEVLSNRIDQYRKDKEIARLRKEEEEVLKKAKELAEKEEKEKISRKELYYKLKKEFE